MMGEVWLAFEGEYEQECCIGVFASRDLLVGAFPGEWYWADYSNRGGRWLEGPVRTECHELTTTGPTREVTGLRVLIPHVGMQPEIPCNPDGSDLHDVQ